MRLALAIVVGLAAVPAVAPAAPSRSQVEKQAVAIYNRATVVVSHSRACRLPRPTPPTLTHAAPSAELLATLGILRRPASPDDVLPQGRPPLIPFTRNIYEDYVRVAHAADGTSYYIVAAQDALALPPRSSVCMHRLHRTLLRLLRGKPARVRRRALHFFDGALRENRRLAHRPPQEGVFLFERRTDGLGGGGGGATASQIREGGMFNSSGTREGRAHVSGLIPDGVATVSSTFSRIHPRGAHRRPRIYPKVLVRTDPVLENVVSFSVARDAEDAFPSKMVWRAADGSVVRVVRL